MTRSPRRPRASLAAWLLLVPWTFVAAAIADEPATRPIVVGFERFHRGETTDDAEGGRLLVGELNCTSCHRGEGVTSGPVSRKQAPILDGVGARIKRHHLRAYLADPRGVKPGSTMPDLLGGLPKAEAEATVDALVHFLASTGTATETATFRKLAGRGKVAFEQSGCAACHGVPGEPSAAMATSVPLGDVGGKYTFNSLVSFLGDPLTTRPSGRMPSLNLKPAEAQSIASYLMKDVPVDLPPGLAYRYYEGEWEKVPDFDALAPTSSGLAGDFDVAVARRADDFAIRFEGSIEVDQAGPHAFFLASDDGSKLWVDGRVVVDNDGVHARQTRTGRARLTKGRHQVVVGYFQGGNEGELDVEFEGPGVSRRPLAAAIVPPAGAAPGPEAADRRFVPDPSKVDKGRALFASVGCASCHRLKEGDRETIAPRGPSIPLAGLRADAGCLAAEPPRGVPDYDLSPHQRAAIASAIRAVGSTRPTTDPEAIARTLVAFNCYACHVRDGVGGVEPGRDQAFATTQKEMGDEGRIPPLLTGVGGKLTDAWLGHVLADGAKDRPYMLTRMPKFGEANVGHLARPLAAVDAVEPVPAPHFDVPERRIKATGRYIVGSQAFNCGSCHQFREFQAAGIQALDMTLMTRRLRREWFHRYVVDPPAFRPGTRMPTAWPGGKSQLDAIFEGDTPKQVESIWAYLSDGTGAAVPQGLGRDPIPLVVDRQAVLYRNFIAGAGPRAIGVGYPEKANLAFDANDLRVALIWQGAFIDASRHWLGRGEGFQAPLGDNVLTLPAGPTLAILPDEAAEWPRAKAKGRGDRFLGYRLAEGGRPVFRYDVGPVHVEDFPEGVTGPQSATIRRTLDITSEAPSKGLTLRAAVGRAITPQGDGWFGVDGEWKVRITSASPPTVRESAGKAELIVPIGLEAGKARVVAEYAW